MPRPINLSPSTDKNALVDAIQLANEKNRTLNLLPGTHLTKPGYGPSHRIKIGANGLRIKGIQGLSENPPRVKRPDYSINRSRPDNNHGLFFIPNDATDEDFESITSWKHYTDNKNNKFLYAVILRGTIEIDNVIFDCNMLLQDLYGIPQKKKEHSCMVGFAGTSTERNSGPYRGKRIYIAFEKVVIKNITTLNGGFADDIWISRGYFNPNIEEIKILNIKSGPRVEPHRGTICFSGLAKKIQIENADIYRLECEETSTLLHTWNKLPRKDSEYTPSLWILKNITADHIGIATKEKAIRILGNNLYAKASSGFNDAGGIIQNSTFNKGEEPRLIRLNVLIFKNVKWILSNMIKNKKTGRYDIMDGLRVVAHENKECAAFFIRNEFQWKGGITTGTLINSEYSRGKPGNIVFLNFFNCTYDSRFGTKEDIFIIRAVERGTWRITKSDFGSRDINKALFKNPELTDVVIQLI